MSDSLYAKVEKPYRRDKILAFFQKQTRVGTERTSSGLSIQTVGASKAKLWKCVFDLCTDGLFCKYSKIQLGTNGFV